jgi:hypothetical protein
VAVRLEPEFRVNASKDGVQQSASVAMAGDGGFVAVWQSEVAGRGDEIRARQFDARGAARGDEIAVNTLTAGRQNVPAVAIALDGSFVVAWQSIMANHLEVRARPFDARGVPRGDEIAVNVTKRNTNGAPDVAMAPGGSFVVVWESAPRGSFEIRARRFDARGSAQGGEIAVSALGAASQRAPRVASDAAGNFVVAWRSNVDGRFEVRARRFTAAGEARGDEIAATAVPAGEQLAPDVAMDADGDFVLAWENAFDGRYGVRARRFTSGGVAREGDVTFRGAGAAREFAPAVAMSADGGFWIAWHSLLAGNFDIRARGFAPSGVPLGEEIVLNQVTAGTQKNAAIAVDSNGAFVALWHGDATGNWEVGARLGRLGREPRRVAGGARAKPLPR